VSIATCLGQDAHVFRQKMLKQKTTKSKVIRRVAPNCLGAVTRWPFAPLSSAERLVPSTRPIYYICKAQSVNHGARGAGGLRSVGLAQIPVRQILTHLMSPGLAKPFTLSLALASTGPPTIASGRGLRLPSQFQGRSTRRERVRPSFRRSQ
jgi:hypothetical protein